MRRGVCTTVIGALSLLVASSAGAAGNDFRLNARLNTGEGIFFSENGVNFTANNDAFKSFVGELSYVFAPRLAGPAETLGYAGFDVGLSYASTFVSSGESYWLSTDNGQTSGDPDSALQAIQLDVRKGLPGSFNLGVNLRWIANSEMFAPGLLLDWAVVEGYSVAPDIALRGGVNTVVGMRDMDLTVMSFDVAISKGFGVAGMFNLAPYLTYSLMLSVASSRIIDPTPTNETDADKSIVMDNIGAGDLIQHRITIGGRMLVYVLTLSIQGEFEFLSDEPDGRSLFGSVATVSTKLGLDF